ncbi:MAG: dihydrodipicolinate synthase family protein [Candidatus Hydrogenedentota bacterium]
MAKIHGLLPATLTPMTESGDLMLDVVPTQAESFLNRGAAGAFINGTTAEWASLSVTERKSITKSWADATDSSFCLIDHVGHHNQREAVELAEHAATCGVRGIAVVAPSYYQLTTPEDVLNWCKPIAEAAGGTPFYYYDLPGFTNIQVSAFDAVELLAEEIPTFAGLKYSGIEPSGLQKCVNLHEGKYTVFFGSDENLLLGLVMGATAGVGSTYNLALTHYVKVIAAFEAGKLDEARGLQYEALKMVDIMLPHGVIPSLKALQPMTGYAVGGCRLPFRRLSDSTTRQITAEVTALGIVEE